MVLTTGNLLCLSAVAPMHLPRSNRCSRGGRTDIEFVDADDEPYGTISALKPDLVVINLSLDDPAGFELLTMLRLDPETSSIPVLSYVRDEDVAALGPVPVDHTPGRLGSVLLARAQRH